MRKWPYSGNLCCGWPAYCGAFGGRLRSRVLCWTPWRETDLGPHQLIRPAAKVFAISSRRANRISAENCYSAENALNEFVCAPEDLAKAFISIASAAMSTCFGGRHANHMHVADSRRAAASFQIAISSHHPKSVGDAEVQNALWQGTARDHCASKCAGNRGSFCNSRFIEHPTNRIWVCSVQTSRSVFRT
jgi:hypothetical protein